MSKLNIVLWIRSKSANYGAEKYAQEVYSSLKLLSESDDAIESVKIKYMAKGEGFLKLCLNYLFFFLQKKDNTCLNIYTFPFFPLRLNPDNNILIFHHADPLRGSWKSRFTEMFGLICFAFIKKTTNIITVSPYWQSFLIAKFNLREVSVIYNPITLEISDRLENNQGHFKTIFPQKLNIYLGNASIKKGWPKSLTIASRVFADATYWVSGDQYEEIESSNVKHFRRSYSEFLDFLQTVDISIFYSQFLEGWNRTLIEAALMSNSYILVYSRSGGASDAVSLFSNGITFDDDQDLHDKLVTIQRDIENGTRQNSCDHSQVLSLLNRDNFNSSWRRIIYKLSRKQV